MKVQFSSVQSLNHVDSLQPHRLQPARLLCPWDSPGKNGLGNGLPFPPPGDLPDPGIKPASLTSPALADRFFTTSATWEVHKKKIDMEIYTRRKKGLLELGESGNASSKEMTFKFAFKG